jgi:DNA (cytosine-5)-methyltransferase 1
MSKKTGAEAVPRYSLDGEGLLRHLCGLPESYAVAAIESLARRGGLPQPRRGTSQWPRAAQLPGPPSPAETGNDPTAFVAPDATGTTARPRVVSLFCGAGGLDLGFARAGFEVIWANDAWADACATYRRNVGPHVVCADVRSVNPRRLPPCDVVIGGPPCQGFSVAGKRNPDDPRSALVWEFVRFVRAVRPQAFVLENVPPLATSARWGPARERLLRALRRLGYRVRPHVLDAQHFGVAQRRERAFFVGTARGLPPWVPPPPVADPPRTAGEVLRVLPPPGTAGNEGPCPARVVPARRPERRRSPYAGMLFNGWGRPIDLGRPAPTLPATMGGNKTPVVDEAELRGGEPPWTPEYRRHLEGGGAPLTEAPPRLRRLTLTEAALLQTFPAEFRFEGRPSSRYAQIGNAVPPLLAEAVARQLLRSLRGTASDP